MSIPFYYFNTDLRKHATVKMIHYLKTTKQQQQQTLALRQVCEKAPPINGLRFYIVLITLANL